MTGQDSSNPENPEPQQLLIYTDNVCAGWLYELKTMFSLLLYLSRRLERPQVDVFDMARLRLQAPVRRPSSRNAEPRNLLQIHDSLQLKYNGTLLL